MDKLSIEARQLTKTQKENNDNHTNYNYATQFSIKRKTFWEHFPLNLESKSTWGFGREEKSTVPTSVLSQSTTRVFLQFIIHFAGIIDLFLSSIYRISSICILGWNIKAFSNANSYILGQSCKEMSNYFIKLMFKFWVTRNLRVYVITRVAVDHNEPTFNVCFWSGFYPEGSVLDPARQNPDFWPSS